MLELIAATVIMGTALVPALRMVRDGMTISRDNETRSLIVTFCASKMDEHLTLAAASWTTGTFTGTFSTEGYSTIKWKVVRDDAASAGGVSGKLMSITTTVWYDTNGDGSVSTGELNLVLATKVAKMALYQAAAGG
jgi:hypothetical protein